MQSKKQRKALISVAVVAAVLLIVLLSLYFTGTWFIVNRKAEGTLQFREGIKIHYTGLYEDDAYASTATNRTLTLARLERNLNNKKLPLKVGDVTSANRFEVINPTLSPKEGTVDFYLRAKFNIDLYFKGTDGQEKLITDETRAEFLTTISGYELNKQPIAITNERELFEKLPEIDDTKFTLIDGWYYCGVGGSTLATLGLTTFKYNSEENPQVSLFKNNDEYDGGRVMLYLNHDIDYGENMPFTRMELSLTVEAVETGALSIWTNSQNA